jgi:16S rRNA (guanine966-N2)-methyltransferase
MMRVIAGSAKGTKLKTLKGLSVRPTADRVKEALFNIIGTSVIDSVFVDLFAGSGAVGIEALSRGAASTIFIDHSRINIELIKDNLEKTRLTERAQLLCSDAGRAIDSLAAENNKADLIFIDPPYDLANVELIVSQIITKALINPSGLVIVEHSAKNARWVDSFSDCRRKKYGNTSLTFITPPGSN